MDILKIYKAAKTAKTETVFEKNDVSLTTGDCQVVFQIKPKDAPETVLSSQLEGKIVDLSARDTDKDSVTLSEKSNNLLKEIGKFLALCAQQKPLGRNESINIKVVEFELQIESNSPDISMRKTIDYPHHPTRFSGTIDRLSAKIIAKLISTKLFSSMTFKLQDNDRIHVTLKDENEETPDVHIYTITPNSYRLDQSRVDKLYTDCMQDRIGIVDRQLLKDLLKDTNKTHLVHFCPNQIRIIDSNTKALLRSENWDLRTSVNFILDAKIAKTLVKRNNSHLLSFWTEPVQQDQINKPIMEGNDSDGAVVMPIIREQ